MRVDQQILRTLLAQKEPVSASKLAFSIGISEKTVQKYMGYLKEMIKGQGAEIITRQRVGSSIRITDRNLFRQFLSEFDSESYLEDPNLRKSYVMTRLLTTDEYISIYDLSEEISSSPSLTRNILKELKSTLDSYDLRLKHSHLNGYRIEGEEKNIRRCLVQECRKYDYIADTLASSSLDSSEKDRIYTIIAEAMEHYSISVSTDSIHSLTLHALIAINRIETGNPIELRDDLDLQRLKSKIEYTVSCQIASEIEKLLHIAFTEKEVIYFSMHISGQQRFLGHESLQVSVSDSALVFYNRFLRNIWKYADEDFFGDDELRTSLLNHIVPFMNRVNNEMQIERSELNNIKSEFPYAYDLSVTGLSFLDQSGTHISEVEISYFALHLQLAIEKRENLSNLRYNVLCICEETSGIFHMLSYKINRHFQKQINEIIFTSVTDLPNFYLNDYQIILNATERNLELPENAVRISPYINDEDIQTLQNVFNHLSSRIMNNVILKDYLFFEMDAENRNEIFERMTEQIRKYIHLPDDFLERLNRRESMSSTEYDNRIAIPHPIDMADIPEFISVVKLEKPVIWHVKPVQLIFLICNKSDINPMIYTKLSQIIRSPELSQKLIQSDSFSDFRKIIESI